MEMCMFAACICICCFGQTMLDEEIKNIPDEAVNIHISLAGPCADTGEQVFSLYYQIED